MQTWYVRYLSLLVGSFAIWMALLGAPTPVQAQACEYIVRAGDTLSRIATRTQTPVRNILRANPQITNPNVIRVGQRLLLPDCGAAPPPAAPAPGNVPAPSSPAPAPPLGSLPSYPARPRQIVPAPPTDLAGEMWKRAHDATINIRHPIEAPKFSGSGIVVGHDGRTFITAYHVIGDPLFGTEAKRVSIGPFGEWRFTADVIATDPSIDIAILRVNEPDFPGFAVAPLGISEVFPEGQPIYTLSYPGTGGSLVGGKGHYLTQVLTFRNRSPLILTDASANYGSSGGVAVNAQGEVIGIITGGVFGRENLELLGFPDLAQATLIVPIDAANELLHQVGLR